jgi:hypothetical protein
MNRGFVKLWRKYIDDGWIRNHKLWAFWTWCLLKATHKEFDAIVGFQTVHLMPGQFITGRHKACEETGLTEQEYRTVTAFLAKEGKLTIKSTNKYSIITIVNWNTYQSTNPDDQPTDQPTTNQQVTTYKNIKNIKNKETPDNILSEISDLGKRYPDQEIINQVFQAISSTRKSNRIADNVKLSILRSWYPYPVDSIMAGIKTYLEKGYHHQGKDEKYLLGIIRNSNGTETKDAPQGQTMKSTGSRLYDAYQRGEIKVDPEGTSV